MQGIGSAASVTEHPDRNRPQALLVPAEQSAERARVALEVHVKQLSVRQIGRTRRDWTVARGAR